MSDQRGGGLKAPNVVGLGANEQQKIHSEWNTFDNVQIELMREGVMPVDKPTVACQRLTAEQLTTLDDKRYAETYAHICSWFGYISDLLARTRGAILEVENEMKYVWASLRAGAIQAAEMRQEKKPADKEIEMTILLDPSYKQLKLSSQNLDQRKLVLEAQADLLEKDLKMVSRQVELRKMEREREKIGDGMAGRGYVPGRM